MTAFILFLYDVGSFTLPSPIIVDPSRIFSTSCLVMVAGKDVLFMLRKVRRNPVIEVMSSGAIVWSHMIREPRGLHT